MYKIVFLLNKYSDIIFIMLMFVIYPVAEFIFQNKMMSIFLSIFIALTFSSKIYSVYYNYPLRYFRKTCKLILFKENIDFAEKRTQRNREIKNIKILNSYYKYVSLGPSSEIIKELEKKINNSSKYCLDYYYLLFLCFVELRDKESFEKYLNVLFNNIKNNKFYKIIIKIVKKQDDTLLRMYDMIIKNDGNSEKLLLSKLHSKKLQNKLDITIIYYFLSLYYNQNSDSESEKKVLKKVIEFGDETYMAKNARERLKKLNS